MRIIFFGEDSFSNIILQSLIYSGHNVLLVVSPWYDNLIHKRLENTCFRNQIEYTRIKDLNSIEFIRKLKDMAPEMIVVSHFEKLLKKEIIDIPKLGCINLHPSLLPNYRGMSPQHWPIINGESETGITVHYIDETADTGDIILQKKVEINPDMYVSELQLEFIKTYKTIVVEAIDLIKSNGFIPVKQSSMEGSYYGKLKRHQCQISFNSTCKQVYNLIRGVSKPYFGAYISDIIIWKAHLANKYESIELTSYDNKGLNYSHKYGYFLKLNDGLIIVDKFEKIIKNESENN